MLVLNVDVGRGDREQGCWRGGGRGEGHLGEGGRRPLDVTMEKVDITKGAHDLLGDLHHLVVVDGEVPLYYYLSAMSD